jgi:dihydrofolate reductase
MRIIIVVAVADNGVIGKDNALLWRLPDDMKFFKSITMGKPIVMGRKTYASIGRPLPGRKNIVISRQNALAIDRCVVVDSLVAAFASAGDVAEVAIVGGAEIYKQSLPFADTIYLTRVHAQIAGDVFFPELDAKQWEAIHREDHPADDRHAYAFSFVKMVRRKP